MPGRRLRLVAIGGVASLAVLSAAAAAGQQAEEPDGLARVELTLAARQISVGYEPALRASDPAHALLLSASPDVTQAEVRLGHLRGHRALRFGTLSPDAGESPRSGPDHELWLTRTGSEWALDARPLQVDAEDATEEAPTLEPLRIPLTHRTRPDKTSETLTVALVPNGDDAGELALLWGAHDWRASFEFFDLPRQPLPERTSNVGRANSLTRDSDTSAAYRAAALGARNETAVMTPDGDHIQILFQKDLGTDHRDFAALETTADGELVELSGGAVIRLRTELPLRFGDTLVPTDNLATDFPGSYGLWLKATGGTWRLVFNHEADSWGTQHDPAFDAVEIDVEHTHGGPFTDRPLAVYLHSRGKGRVGLVIHWGQHTWSSDAELEP